MAHCAKCGAELALGSTFCSACGTPVRQDVAPQPQYRAVRPAWHSNLMNARNKLAIVAAVSLVANVVLNIVSDAAYAPIYDLEYGSSRYLGTMALVNNLNLVSSIAANIMLAALVGLAVAVVAIAFIKDSRE